MSTNTFCHPREDQRISLPTKILVRYQYLMEHCSGLFRTSGNATREMKPRDESKGRARERDRVPSANDQWL